MADDKDKEDHREKKKKKKKKKRNTHAQSMVFKENEGPDDKEDDHDSKFNADAANLEYDEENYFTDDASGQESDDDNRSSSEDDASEKKKKKKRKKKTHDKEENTSTSKSILHAGVSNDDTHEDDSGDESPHEDEDEAKKNPERERTSKKKESKNTRKSDDAQANMVDTDQPQKKSMDDHATEKDSEAEENRKSSRKKTSSKANKKDSDKFPKKSAGSRVGSSAVLKGSEEMPSTSQQVSKTDKLVSDDDTRQASEFMRTTSQESLSQNKMSAKTSESKSGASKTSTSTVEGPMGATVYQIEVRFIVYKGVRFCGGVRVIMNCLEETAHLQLITLMNEVFATYDISNIYFLESGSAAGVSFCAIPWINKTEDGKSQKDQADENTEADEEDHEELNEYEKKRRQRCKEKKNTDSTIDHAEVVFCSPEQMVRFKTVIDTLLCAISCDEDLDCVEPISGCLSQSQGNDPCMFGQGAYSAPQQQQTPGMMRPGYSTTNPVFDQSPYYPQQPANVSQQQAAFNSQMPTFVPQQQSTAAPGCAQDNQQANMYSQRSQLYQEQPPMRNEQPTLNWSKLCCEPSNFRQPSKYPTAQSPLPPESSPPRQKTSALRSDQLCSQQTSGQTPAYPSVPPPNPESSALSLYNSLNRNQSTINQRGPPSTNQRPTKSILRLQSNFKGSKWSFDPCPQDPTVPSMAGCLPCDLGDPYELNPGVGRTIFCTPASLKGEKFCFSGKLKIVQGSGGIGFMIRIESFEGQALYCHSLRRDVLLCPSKEVEYGFYYCTVVCDAGRTSMEKFVVAFPSAYQKEQFKQAIETCKNILAMTSVHCLISNT